jgi:hypothetical protein
VVGAPLLGHETSRQRADQLNAASGVIEPSGNVFAGDRFRHSPVANFPALRRHLDPGRRRRWLGRTIGFSGRGRSARCSCRRPNAQGCKHCARLAGCDADRAIGDRDISARTIAFSCSPTFDRASPMPRGQWPVRAAGLRHPIARPGSLDLAGVRDRVGRESGVAPGGVLLWRPGDLIDDQLRANRAVGVGRRSGETDPLFRCDEYRARDACSPSIQTAVRTISEH